MDDKQTHENTVAVDVGSGVRFGGICWIGETALLNGSAVVVMDTDMLNGEAKVGTLDANGLVWDARWLSWAFLCKPNVKMTYAASDPSPLGA